MRWNDSGSRTYGPDLVFMAGTLQGYGYAQLRHDDPDCYDLDDARVHLLPRVRTPADAALVLLTGPRAGRRAIPSSGSPHGCTRR